MHKKWVSKLYRLRLYLFVFYELFCTFCIVFFFFFFFFTERAQADEFLDMVAGIQGSRMNDQRAAMPKFPGLHNSQEVLDQLMNKSDDATHLDDGFFEMLMRCQVCMKSLDEQEICYFIC